MASAFRDRFTSKKFDPTMTLAGLSHECDPEGGDLGRGWDITREQFENLEPDLRVHGWCPYIVAGSSTPWVQIYAASGAPAAKWWRGYTRMEGDRCLIIAFESYEPFFPAPTYYTSPTA